MERAFVILVAAFGKDEAPRAWAPFGRQGQGFSVVDHGGSGGFGVWGGEDEDDPWAQERWSWKQRTVLQEILSRQLLQRWS